MKNDDIENLLDQLNEGIKFPQISLFPLSENVAFAKVWRNEPKGGIANEKSENFYFIKIKTGVYVGAVFDMGTDLHVFVKPKHRGHGYLTRAMHQIILPHLYQGGRTIQRVTFEDPKVATYINKHWKFELNGSQSASKSLIEYAGIPKITAHKRKVTKGDFQKICKWIDRSRLYITMAAEQLESALGGENDGVLRDMAADLQYLDNYVLDTIEDAQGVLAN